ncbi:transcription initiation factor TFIID [Paenibacillus sp. J5C2022]|uniref:transcription initiation factor TFIID n=1 Tax=Paenibacillus sp. J5C2022 TaxID=2977129 RepID=UPI0021CEA148|nr:transcription initiation factor TFIID [Paenibacillus sp. J5C2022]
MIEQFATDYTLAEQRLQGAGDDQSSIHYPTVFLYIGEEIAEAIKPMMEANSLRWANNAGVVYCHVGGSGEGSAAGSSEGFGDEAVNRFTIALAGLYEEPTDRRTARAEIGRRFHEAREHLARLNRALRSINDAISDYGRMYASFDRLHLAVITRADDPMNILVPDIALLAESIFATLFKSVQTDLFILLQEREQTESFGYAAAAGVGFLRELERFQHPGFTYSEPLQMTGDGLRIPVSHGPAPLFDLVYLLSDRNEKGMTPRGGMAQNYEAICRILLLKNRSIQDMEHHDHSGSYNNTSFKNSLRAESGKMGYVSAGLAGVQRPAYAIALTVLYHLLDGVIVRLQAPPELDEKEKLHVFGIDMDALERTVAECIPGEERLEDMKGLMTSGCRFDDLRGKTLEEAGKLLFGDSCESFFKKHYDEPAGQRLQRMDVAGGMRRALERSARSHPHISFYHLFKWTDEGQADGEVTGAVRDRMRELSGSIQHVQEELDEVAAMRVEDLKFARVPFMDKRNMRSFIHAYIDAVYGLRREKLQMETELSLYRRYALELEMLHQWNRVRLERLNDLRSKLKKEAQHSIAQGDGYIGQNVFDYYERVTAEVIRELEEKRGGQVLFEERYIGHVLELLEQGEAALVERLIAVCRRDILTSAKFSLAFEEELLQRANVSVAYDNRRALPKEELFRQLYRMLEEHATIHIRLFDYTHKNRYEEHYMFGDRESEFIRYALHTGDSARIHKLGCLHEERRSGVERLHLMGGFHLEDLLYYRHAKPFYEAYVQDGYKFHAMDDEQLPPLT